jgi:hypothetical protein
MRLLASVIIGPALLLSCLSASYAGLPERAEEFNAFFGTLGGKEKPKGPKTRDTVRLARERQLWQAGQLPKLWDIMDRLVIGLLNDQKTAVDIQEVFSQLSGFEPPRTVSKTIINNVAFSDGVDHEYPNYWIMPVERHGATQLLGVYNDNLTPYTTLVSRVSVYTRKKVGWERTDAFEGTTTLCLYVLPYLHQSKAIMTIEQYLYADRIEGNLKFWKLASGKLRLLAQHDKLLDYGVYREESKLIITYMKFPEHLSQPILGARTHYSIDAAFDKHGLKRRVTCLNPWVEVLDGYFGCLYRKDFKKAKTYLKGPKLLPRLMGCSTITREEGDIDSGEGVVEMSDGKRVVFERGKSNRWVISDVSQQ